MALSKTISTIGKSPFTFSVGEWARQADGSVVCTYGDTVVLATVCMSKTVRPDADFFPMTVEYQERTYAMGKIPGGFIKKEGRPKDEEILNARLIDRPLRPLFPKGMTNEVQIVAMVLSSDAQNDPDVLAINAASCALVLSDIPFDKPVGAVRVSKVNGAYVVNPTYEERDSSKLDLVVVGTETKIVMLEGALQEIQEEEVVEAIRFAHPFIRELIALQLAMGKQAGKSKRAFTPVLPDENLISQLKSKVFQQLESRYGLVKKEERQSAVDEMLDVLNKEFVNDESGVTADNIKQAFYVLEEEFMRTKILREEKRPDARTLNQIRPISCQVTALPRTHGSSVFTRGQTQSLAVVTLGTSSDVQFIEALEGERAKHFMLHYSFPPFSVGEVKMMRGPSRRDIGHGALAEKALLPVVPGKTDFPYTIRVVSEILESNGSSSMASVCAASLAMMDAGVPIADAVAGIAIGLVAGEKEYKILTDIAGIEDHYGDMDFKVAGTKSGITAIQVDTKIDGLSYQMIEDALLQARLARTSILEAMNKVMQLPRKTLSDYAPKIRSFEVDPDKIGAIIGPGGKVIKRIQRENNVTVDIDDETSMVSVAATTVAELERAVNQIQNLVREIEIGDIYEVKVEKIVNFGAFCEIAPGKSGLLHVSEIADEYVKDVATFLKEGDIITVKVIGIDPQGKIRLSLKQAKKTT